MPRPRIPRQLKFVPQVNYFKPQGIPLRFLEEIELSRDELESLQLYEVENLDQISAATQLGVSQPTFARILAVATKKIAQAIVEGKAIKIASEPSPEPT